MASDIDEIKSVAHRFARGLDRRDAKLIRDCFHPDGVDDHGMFRGSVDEFLIWVMEQLAQYERSQHHITTQTVKLQNERAGCESYFYAHHVITTPDGLAQIIVSGRYLDLLEKRGGEWKIAERTFVADWSEMVPLKEIQVPDDVMTPRGQIDRSDPSFAFFESI